MSDTISLSANDNCMFTVGGYLLGVMSMRAARSLTSDATAWTVRFGAIGSSGNTEDEALRPGTDVVAEVRGLSSGKRYRFNATLECIEYADLMSTARFAAIRDVTGLDAFVAAATPVAA